MKNEIRFTLESKQRPKLAQEIGKTGKHGFGFACKYRGRTDDSL